MSLGSTLGVQITQINKTLKKTNNYKWEISDIQRCCWTYTCQHPTPKNYPAPNTSSAEVEKSWARLISGNQQNFTHWNLKGIRWYSLFPSLSRALNTLKRWKVHKAGTLSGHCHKDSSYLCPSSALDFGVWWDLYIPECKMPLWFLSRSCFWEVAILRWILIGSGGRGRWGEGNLQSGCLRR